jgi:hypothetical protein
MSKPKRKYMPTIIASTGIILITTGISLWLYTNSVIQGYQQILNDDSKLTQQRSTIEDSLQMWRKAKTITYDPLSVILLTIGLCAIEYTIIYLLVQPS